MAKMVEVDEEELRSNRQLREVVSRIYANPKAKLLVQEATKIIDPNARTPELDEVKARAEVIDPVVTELKELKKQLADEKTTAENDRKLSALQTSIDSGLAKLARDERLTADGVAAVRKLMDDEGIVNPEIAWAVFEKRNPPQSLVSPNGSGAWNFLETPTGDADADVTKLIDALNPAKGGSSNAGDLIVNKMARDALNEVRGSPRR